MNRAQIRPAELDPWARAWCHCQAAPRAHAHVPGGLALLFPDERDQAAAAARRHRRIVYVAAAVWAVVMASLILFGATPTLWERVVWIVSGVVIAASVLRVRLGR